MMKRRNRQLSWHENRLYQIDQLQLASEPKLDQLNLWPGERRLLILRSPVQTADGEFDFAPGVDGDGDED